MGRGLILFIVGMFIVMGIYNFSSQNRLLSSEEDMARQVHYMMATGVAQSGLEEAAQQVVLNNPDFRDDGQVWLINHDDGQGSITMTRAGNNIQLRSVATTEEATAVITGEYTLQMDGSMPILDAALGFYSKSLKFDTKGNSFKISGCDHLPQVDVSTDCDDMYGISVNDSDNVSIITNGLPGSRKDNVTGVGGTPSIGVVDNDGSFIDEAIKYFGSNADMVLKDYLMVDKDQIGSRTSPKIVHVKAGGELRVANATGSGVIIIDQGATLDVRGTFNFEGLILVQGKADLTRGNMHLYGGMLFGGEEPELQIYESELELTGNINIRYSSQVMQNLDQYFSAGSGNRRLVLQQLYQ